MTDYPIRTISGTVPLPTDAATATNQTTQITEIGAVNETAPATDTASSGLNGRLQRIAQRIASFLAPVTAASATATQAILAGLQYNSTLPTFTTGQQGTLQGGTRGGLHVNIYGADSVSGAAAAACSVDSNAASAIGLVTKTNLHLFNGSTWDRAYVANAIARLLSSANTTNGTNVKASAGRVHRITGYNTNAAARYLKLYNKATAPTVGTDVPVATIRINPTAFFDYNFGDGLYFATGIGYGLTTAAADNDTGALSSGDVECMNVLYS